jgi:hypothetical protein
MCNRLNKFASFAANRSREIEKKPWAGFFSEKFPNCTAEIMPFQR